MRNRLLNAILVIFLIPLSACSDVGGSNPGPDAAPSVSTGVDNASPPVGDLSPSVAEGPSDAPFGVVVSEFRFDEEGEIRLAVHFANPEVTDRPQLAEKCVQFYSDQDVDTVSCYAYESVEAVEAAEPDPSTGGVGELCWRSYFSRASSGATAGSETNPSYGASCP
jgi:hypothetical protein